MFKIDKEELKYKLNELKKSSALIGTLAIVIAVIIGFVLIPAFTRALNQRVDVLVATRDIKIGEVITDNMFTMVKVGGFNINPDIATKKEDIKDKYAIVDIMKDTYIYKKAVNDIVVKDDDYLYTEMTGFNRAISFSVKDLANGVSNKIIKGDIISIIIVDKEAKKDKAIIPDELRYVEVLTTTEQDGLDISEKPDKDKRTSIYETITCLVCDEQAKIIAEAETTKTIYVELVYRAGSKNVVNYFLNKQNELLNKTYKDRITEKEAKQLNTLFRQYEEDKLNLKEKNPEIDEERKRIDAFYEDVMNNIEEQKRIKELSATKSIATKSETNDDKTGDTY